MHISRFIGHAAAAAALLLAMPLRAADAPQPADLDLSIRYYSRVLTPEGVLRESRYEEKMLRRQNHVWTVRLLPKQVTHAEDHADKPRATTIKATSNQAATHEHKHFNYVVLPRHVVRDGDKVKLEFVDFHDRAVVSIAPSEYENVNFDGSWNNAFFIVDPKQVVTLPLSNKTSSVAGARWREREKDGVFQRVLWDEKRMIPLVIETGNRQETFFQRIEAEPQSKLVAALPWLDLKGYAQKEYADFLD
jgi:hypothetical protein